MEPTLPEETRPFRVIVTGSRDWRDSATVFLALNDLLHEHDDRLVLVHGACLTGADGIADWWAKDAVEKFGHDVTVERHPANWDRHDRAAGPIRNQEMVDLGADVLLAFQVGNSRGTADCIRRAEKADIPVRRYQRTSRA